MNKNMNVFLIIGLPGSGKTHLANLLAENEESVNIVVDDITNLNQLPNKNECDNLLITDVNFCDENIRKKAIKKLNELYDNPYIWCLYFENDIDKCRKNIRYRNDGRNVEGTLKRFSKIYTIPNTHKPIRIWQSD